MKDRKRKTTQKIHTAKKHSRKTEKNEKMKK